MKTVNDLIKELQNLPDKYRELPCIVQSENGLHMDASVKMVSKKEDIFNPEKVIITYA